MTEKLSLYERKMKRQLVKHPKGLIYMGHSRVEKRTVLEHKMLDTRGSMGYVPTFGGKPQTIYVGHENTVFGRVIIKNFIYDVKYLRGKGWVATRGSRRPVEQLISDKAKTWPEWLAQKRKEIGIRPFENDPSKYPWEKAILEGKIAYRS